MNDRDFERMEKKIFFLVIFVYNICEGYVNCKRFIDVSERQNDTKIMKRYKLTGRHYGKTSLKDTKITCSDQEICECHSH